MLFSLRLVGFSAAKIWPPNKSIASRVSLAWAWAERVKVPALCAELSAKPAKP